MKTVAYKLLGEIHVVLLGESTPTDADWNAYMAAVQEARAKGLEPERMRTLVITDGGGPSAAQRKRVNDDLQGKPTPVAMVSSSLMVRGVVTALQWFNPLVKTFPPEQVGEALKFLKIPERQYDTIWKEAQKLQSELGPLPLKSLKGPFR